MVFVKNVCIHLFIYISDENITDNEATLAIDVNRTKMSKYTFDVLLKRQS